MQNAHFERKYKLNSLLHSTSNYGIFHPVELAWGILVLP